MKLDSIYRSVSYYSLGMKGFKMLRRSIGRNIKLGNIQVEGMRKAKGDPGKIEQIIVNPVVNARDEMANGGKVVLGAAD
jgi:two-component system cell cycle sensor histidine kinase/response regulator CckA